jgi:hypothetical protein
MPSRDEWISKAFDETNSVGDMAADIERGLWRATDDHAVNSAHYIASIIEQHGRDAKRYLSYALRCKEEVE